MLNRRSFNSQLARSVLSAGFSSFLFVAMASAAEPCWDAFNKEIARLGIGEGEVETITVVAETTSSGGASSGWATGYDAWIRLKSCKGNLVLHASVGCNIHDAYTRGGCRVPGVPNR